MTAESLAPDKLRTRAFAIIKERSFKFGNFILGLPFDSLFKASEFRSAQ
jgi:hypothetical protein